MPDTPTRMTPEHLYDLTLFSGCTLSPDGQTVCYAQHRVDRTTEKKYANLWWAATDGSRPPRQLTVGNQQDTRPQWSPDRRHIAFLSNRQDEEQSQLFVIPVDGGEARPLTDLKGTFGSFDWSRDGAGLAFSFRKQDADAIERAKDPQKEELGVVARHITRVFYKEDGTGFLPKERWHLWTVDLEGGEAAQLTDGPVHDQLQPAWSPDGTGLAYASNVADDPDLEYEAWDLFIREVATGATRRLELPYGEKRWPRFSPDGRQVAYLGKEGKGAWWRNTQVWVAPTAGGEARCVTASFDLAVDGWTIGDTLSPETVAPTWSPDGQYLYVAVATQGRTGVFRLSVDEPEAREMAPGSGVVARFALDGEGRRLALLHGSFEDPCQIRLMDLEGQTVQSLTRANRSFFEGLSPGECEEVWLEGDPRLHGWILRPPGCDIGQPHPTIIQIHGGPHTQYGDTFVHEFQVLAARGYVVAFCNPRGSKGYGEAFAGAIDNDWGGADTEDITRWTDYVAGLPYVDAGRMGVTGGSYGGFMTNWLIGQTHRFKAAVTQRCVSNLISMYGSSDFNWLFQREFGDRPVWEAMENYWRQSPMKYIGNARTPTLVIHSEEDHRCDMEQGEQVFVALKVLGVPTELVRFPAEPHGLSRGGRTDRRIVRLHHIMRWFDRFLQPTGEPPAPA